MDPFDRSFLGNGVFADFFLATCGAHGIRRPRPMVTYRAHRPTRQTSPEVVGESPTRRSTDCPIVSDAVPATGCEDTGGVIRKTLCGDTK